MEEATEGRKNGDMNNRDKIKGVKEEDKIKRKKKRMKRSGK